MNKILQHPKILLILLNLMVSSYCLEIRRLLNQHEINSGLSSSVDPSKLANSIVADVAPNQPNDSRVIEVMAPLFRAISIDGRPTQGFSTNSPNKLLEEIEENVDKDSGITTPATFTGITTQEYSSFPNYSPSKSSGNVTGRIKENLSNENNGLDSSTETQTVTEFTPTEESSSFINEDLPLTTLINSEIPLTTESPGLHHEARPRLINPACACSNYCEVLENPFDCTCRFSMTCHLYFSTFYKRLSSQNSLFLETKPNQEEPKQNPSNENTLFLEITPNQDEMKKHFSNQNSLSLETDPTQNKIRKQCKEKRSVDSDDTKKSIFLEHKPTQKKMKKQLRNKRSDGMKLKIDASVSISKQKDVIRIERVSTGSCNCPACHVNTRFQFGGCDCKLNIFCQWR